MLPHFTNSDGEQEAFRSLPRNSALYDTTDFFNKAVRILEMELLYCH